MNIEKLTKRRSLAPWRMRALEEVDVDVVVAIVTAAVLSCRSFRVIFICIIYV